MNIKPLFSLFLVLAMNLLFFSSCHDAVDGDWDPIKVDQSSVNIPSSGGTAVIKQSNYNGWWISDIMFPNPSDAANPIYVTPDSDLNKLEGAWYKVEVQANAPKEVHITLTPNDSVVDREMYLTMTAGDIFKQIHITQAH